jgi:hypothetical protein
MQKLIGFVGSAIILILMVWLMVNILSALT